MGVSVLHVQGPSSDLGLANDPVPCTGSAGCLPGANPLLPGSHCQPYLSYVGSPGARIPYSPFPSCAELTGHPAPALPLELYLVLQLLSYQPASDSTCSC